jgi:membrane protein YdbS with pleckstrin-like domain
VPGTALLLNDFQLGPVRPVWIALAVSLYPLARAVFFVDRQYKNWGYLLTERELVTRRGVWWKSATFIPRESIQHVDINQGPIDRWQGLAQVVVHTAGTGAVAFIPGLGLAEAQELRDRLAATPAEAE